MKIDYSKIEVIDIDGIDHGDYPDYVDAYITEAEYDGKPMTDEMIDEINDNDQFRYEAVWDYIH